MVGPAQVTCPPQHYKTDPMNEIEKVSIGAVLNRIVFHSVVVSRVVSHHVVLSRASATRPWSLVLSEYGLALCCCAASEECQHA
eukprot:20182-Eustigmatos_ZCMA.PRE.1